MEKINLIVVDSNEEVTNSIKKYFEVRSNKNVVNTFNDGEKAMHYIKNNQNDYDVIIMDLLLPNMDGMSILEKMKSLKIEKKVIVLSTYLNVDIANKASSLNVANCMLKPFNMESLDARIEDVYNKEYVNSSIRRDLELEVSEMLHNLGVPSHIRGYQYIRDGIMYLYNKNSYVSYITKEIYPEIAGKYETTSSRVERAIRHAIEISWDRGDLNLMDDLFGHSINYDRSKPTNSEYINTIADRMKLKNKVAA